MREINKYMADKGLLYLMEAAVPWYAFNATKRQYHNLNHAFEVTEACRTIADSVGLKERTSLYLAAMWHDAVYVPQAGGSANEDCSAAALNSACEPEERESGVTGRAEGLISNTTVEDHLMSIAMRPEGELAMLLDADLSGLASDWGTFYSKQIRIIQENYGTGSDEDHENVGTFLGKLLTCREHVYHTDYGRTNFEAKARANVKRWREL